MEGQLKDLLARFRRLALPLVIGFFIIIFAALGIVYFQQQQEQNSLKAQIAQLENTLNQPLPEINATQYEEAHEAVPVLTEEEVLLFQQGVIDKVVGLAQSYGFDVSTLTISPDKPVTEKVGETSYQALPFSMEIKADYDKAKEFISALDSPPTLKSLVVEGLSITASKTDLDFVVYTKGK